ncbi:hypothetical protein MKW92_042463 [Papaver armeniacum]|nr:hypothetical protein MKW92_042463 [Papaver armeniacum]
MAESCCFNTPLVILPEDVIFQILIWLPVQSLLRFKSVCRSWYVLIKSSHFIQRHTTTIAVNDKNISRLGSTFICRHQSLETQEPTPSFYFLSEEGGFKELEDLGKRLCFKDVTQFCALYMGNSVHGIVCMYNTITRDIFLWNPATRQCRLLPKSPNGNPKDGYSHHDFVGLGFDVESKDYKVIQVSYLESEGDRIMLPFYCPRKVQIYCLSTDSWRLIDSDFRIQCGFPSVGRSLNGIYFHQAVDHIADPHQTVILSVDLSKEKYQRKLKIPENNFIQLESIGDKLACVTFSRERSMIYKVWMLNDYNTVNESWSKLYIVDLLSPRLTTRYGYCGMLAISYRGKFGLIRGKTLVCYNSITDEFEDFGFGFEDLGFGKGIKLFYFRASIYKESLVSVDANSSTSKALSS